MFSLRPANDGIIIGHPTPVAANVETVLRRSPRKKDAALRARVARCEFNLFQKGRRRHDQQKYQSNTYFSLDKIDHFTFLEKVGLQLLLGSSVSTNLTARLDILCFFKTKINIAEEKNKKIIVRKKLM